MDNLRYLRAKPPRPPSLLKVDFSAPRGFAPLAWLIRVVEGVPFSHVSIRLPVGNNWEVFEASGTSVKMVAEAEWALKHRIVFSIRVKAPQKSVEDTVEFALDHLGQRYSSGEFICLGLLRLGIPRRWLPTKWLRGWVCSTLVAHALHLPNPQEQDPRSVWELLWKKR